MKLVAKWRTDEMIDTLEMLETKRKNLKNKLVNAKNDELNKTYEELAIVNDQILYIKHQNKVNSDYNDYIDYIEGPNQ